MEQTENTILLLKVEEGCGRHGRRVRCKNTRRSSDVPFSRGKSQLDCFSSVQSDVGEMLEFFSFSQRQRDDVLACMYVILA